MSGQVATLISSLALAVLSATVSYIFGQRAVKNKWNLELIERGLEKFYFPVQQYFNNILREKDFETCKSKIESFFERYKSVDSELHMSGSPDVIALFREADDRFAIYKGNRNDMGRVSKCIRELGQNSE